MKFYDMQYTIENTYIFDDGFCSTNGTLLGSNISIDSDGLSINWLALVFAIVDKVEYNANYYIDEYINNIK